MKENVFWEKRPRLSKQKNEKASSIILTPIILTGTYSCTVSDSIHTVSVDSILVFLFPTISAEHPRQTVNFRKFLTF